MILQPAHDATRGDMAARLISNSEVSDFLICERKHYYAHLMKLKRKGASDALTRGIIGHEALASYYTLKMNGESEEDARRAARLTLFQYLDTNQDVVYDLDRILTRYFEYSSNDDWTLLAVEAQYGIPINDDFEYTMRLDVLAIIDGEPTLVDHKFKYNFYTQSELDMNAQVPKYIGTLKYNGVQVERGIMNQLRYRISKDQSDENMFKRTYVKPTPTEIRNTLKEQIVVSERIIERRAMDPLQQSATAMRIMNPMICKNCPFLDLCKSELMGGDISLMVQADFERNDYGYNNDADEVLF